jgi:hypothetical protein
MIPVERYLTGGLPSPVPINEQQSLFLRFRAKN